MPRAKKITLICYGISFAIYSAILLWGLTINSADFFGYGLLSFYLILPVTSFGTALFMQIAKAWLRWLYPFIFSAYGLAIPAIVSYAGLSAPVIFWDVWPFAFIPAFLGSGIGFLVSLKQKS
ncbi:MAG: hypothetical protein FWC76_02180 [Defluviitaleaceae bacterium]|nr:hypothetical protein [Defluviitaleaceae bacterium]